MMKCPLPLFIALTLAMLTMLVLPGAAANESGVTEPGSVAPATSPIPCVYDGCATTSPTEEPATEPVNVTTTCPGTLCPTTSPTVEPTNEPSGEPTISPTTLPTTPEPRLPHLFYGTLTMGGNPGPAGTSVTAIAQGGEGSLVTDKEGYYGNTSPFGNKLIVQGSIEDGTPLSFYANNSPAECYDVQAGGPWQSTHPYTAGAVTELNLRVTEQGMFYSINATAGTGGFIAPTGLITVNPGANLTFSITAFSNYAVQDVAVDGVSKGALPTYSFEHISANHTIACLLRSDLQRWWRRRWWWWWWGNGGSYPTTTLTTVPTTQPKGTTFISGGDELCDHLINEYYRHYSHRNDGNHSGCNYHYTSRLIILGPASPCMDDPICHRDAAPCRPRLLHLSKRACGISSRGEIIFSSSLF